MCERNYDGTYAIGHRGLQGEKNDSWKGDGVGYAGSHLRLYAALYPLP